MFRDAPRSARLSVMCTANKKKLFFLAVGCKRMGLCILATLEVTEKKTWYENSSPPENSCGLQWLFPSFPCCHNLL